MLYFNKFVDVAKSNFLNLKVAKLLRQLAVKVIVGANPNLPDLN